MAFRLTFDFKALAGKRKGDCRKAAHAPGRLASASTVPRGPEGGHVISPYLQVLRRSFSTPGRKEAHPTEMQAQLGHSDIRTTLDIYTRTLDPEVLTMANQVTNRILELGEDREPGSIQ